MSKLAWSSPAHRDRVRAIRRFMGGFRETRWTEGGSLDSYTLFFDSYLSPGQIHVTPINDYFECYIATWNLTQPFVEGERYRLRFRITGNNPVELTGFMDRLNVDYWEVIGSGSVLHDQNSQPTPGGYCNAGSMIPPIAGIGASGFSKYRDPSDRYDNFYTIRLRDDDNPQPTLGSLSPSSATAGSAGFELTLQGGNFVSGSVVRWNGSDRNTTFVSSAEVRASITASDIAAEGSASVSVVNPSPGGGTSNTLSFEIVAAASNPVPDISQLTPDLVVVSDAGFTLTVQGSGFTGDSVVRWNGEDRPTSFLAADQLQAAIDAADISSAGTASITVFNPAPGGGESDSVTLNILDPVTDYFDDFSRPNSANLGGGWIEKAPGAFSLQGDEVNKNGVSSAYRDNIVYRPSDEDLLDVEASVELTLLDNTPGYPQVWVRLQSNSVGNTDTADGYIMYINNSTTEAVVGRQRGTAFVTTLATIYLSAPLNTTDRFRLRLRATGTNPVAIDGYVERLGQNGWEIIGTAGGNDTSGNRIDTAGSVGFGGYIENGYRYDNFTRLNQVP